MNHARTTHRLSEGAGVECDVDEPESELSVNEPRERCSDKHTREHVGAANWTALRRSRGLVTRPRQRREPVPADQIVLVADQVPLATTVGEGRCQESGAAPFGLFFAPGL